MYLYALLLAACVWAVNSPLSGKPLDSLSPQALMLEGAQLIDSNRLADAHVVYSFSTKKYPTAAVTWMNLGVTAKKMGDVASALSHYQNALRLAPQSPDLMISVGNALLALGKEEAALSSFYAAIDQSANPETLLALGNALSQTNNPSKAAGCYRAVLRLSPTHTQALFNLGVTLMTSQSYTEAARYYQRVIEAKPGSQLAAESLASLLVTHQRSCVWRSDRHSLSVAFQRQLQSFLAHSIAIVSPLHSQELPVTPLQQLQLAQLYSAAAARRAGRVSLRLMRSLDNQGDRPRLHLGFVSGTGFAAATTTARLLRSVFALHDARRFKLSCVALKPADGSSVHKAIAQSCPMHYVHHRSHREIAERINSERINVLVDLTGYTINPCPEIFSLQPAAVQMSWHGFPGSMGASYYQMLVSDAIATPVEYQAHYSERLLLLPHTYFANSHRDSHSEMLKHSRNMRSHMRSAVREALIKAGGHALLGASCVLAAFNQLYKLDPDTFSAWVRVLNQTDCVLWLLRYGDRVGDRNLLAAGDAVGLDRRRLVFTDLLPREVEMEAKSLATLFLDTPLYGGHTTGTDVLWSGVPMVCLPREAMASRVSAALSLAVGVSTTLVRSLDDYVSVVVRLVKQNTILQQERERIANGRTSAALWDTAAFVGALERGLTAVWDAHITSPSKALFHSIVRTL